MKNKYWILILAILLVGCLALSLIFMGGEPAARAEITSDGQVVRVVDLHIDQEFTIPSPTGGSNTVTVRDGKIAVTFADCPDQYCVKRGFRNSGTQIVCLPHGLVIDFVDEEIIDGAVG